MLKLTMNTVLTCNKYSLQYLTGGSFNLGTHKEHGLMNPQTSQGSFTLQSKYVLKPPSSLDNWSARLCSNLVYKSFMNWDL